MTGTVAMASNAPRLAPTSELEENLRAGETARGCVTRIRTADLLE